MSNTHLIILPGWGGSKQTWNDFVQIAKPSFASVEVIELPCFGGEPCPTEVWGIDEYSSFAKEKIEKYKSATLRHCEEEQSDDVAIHGQLANVVDRHVARAPRDDVGQFIILGHSFGGQVLAHVVGNNPDICDRVIFAASSIVREDFWFKRSALGLAAKVGKGIFFIPGLRQFEGLAKKVLYKVADSPDYQKTNGVQRDIYKKIIRQDQQQWLDNITIPALVVWGDRDRMTPLKYGTILAKRLRRATFVVIAGATHGLHHETKQKLLNAVVHFCNTDNVTSS